MYLESLQDSVHYYAYQLAAYAVLNLVDDAANLAFLFS